MKVYVTKYALTTGIYEIEVKEDDIYPDKSTLRDGYAILHVGKDCFYSREEAIRSADNMRKKKILSLEKQIKKLKDMRFE